MKRRIVSVCCAMALILDMLILSVQTVAASDTPILDGSYLTHEEESTGYDTKITRGEDLMAGYSKIVQARVPEKHMQGARQLLRMKWSRFAWQLSSSMRMQMMIIGPTWTAGRQKS